MSAGTYEGMRRIAYSDPELGDAIFVPVCERCARFVTANGTVRFNGAGLVDEPNAMCKRCGPTMMLFEGWL